MKELVSPKQVARAIGVSESSLKRWCDSGLIQSFRTAGGHRKLSVSSVLEFLKTSGHQIVNPALLGLPSTVGHGERTITAARSRMRDTLVSGDEAASWQIILDLYLAKNRISVICDDVIAPAFAEIGELWDCGDVEVYQERRSCEISLRILHGLRAALPAIPTDAPAAFGGTLDGDPYTLSTTMAELVLRDNGWNAVSLGNMLPVATLKSAIEANPPKLFWLSVCHIRDEETLVTEIQDLFEVATHHNVAFVVGGRVLTEAHRRRLKYHMFCDTMQHLETFAATLLTR
jgi:methanogenic corrinoid protein MtbC1